MGHLDPERNKSFRFYLDGLGRWGQAAAIRNDEGPQPCSCTSGPHGIGADRCIAFGASALVNRSFKRHTHQGGVAPRLPRTTEAANAPPDHCWVGGRRHWHPARFGGASCASSMRRIRLVIRGRHRPAALPELRPRGAEAHRGDPAAGGDRQDPHPPGVGSPPATPGTGERGGPRVRRRLRSARHPGRAPWAGAHAPQPGWRLRAVSGIRPEHGVAARIATRRRSQPGCVYTRVPPNGRLRVVQPLRVALVTPCQAL